MLSSYYLINKCENIAKIWSLLILFYRKCQNLQTELNKIAWFLLNTIYMSISKDVIKQCLLSKRTRTGRACWLRMMRRALKKEYPWCRCGSGWWKGDFRESDVNVEVLRRRMMGGWKRHPPMPQSPCASAFQACYGRMGGWKRKKGLAAVTRRLSISFESLMKSFCVFFSLEIFG